MAKVTPKLKSLTISTQQVKDIKFIIICLGKGLFRQILYLTLLAQPNNTRSYMFSPNKPQTQHGSGM